MPNDFSNFTMPDQGSTSGGYKGTVTPTYNPRRYGGRGEALDENGQLLAGTSGAAQDIGYYSKLANTGGPTTPVIDQTASNESRGFQLNSLDTLKGAADGTSLSPAAALGYQQGRAAMAAGSSMAASVRGGAMARAAAARASTMNNAQTLARTKLAASAAQANAMATARGQLVTAANGMRAEDLTVATDQAKLEAANRAAADQRKQHYDQSGFDVANAENNAAVGISSQDANAANAARLANQQANTTAQANARTVVSTITGGGMGAIQGASAGQTPGKPDPDPYSTQVSNSDERMKYGIKDVGEHMKHAASKVLEGARDLRDRYLPREPSPPAGTEGLHAAIRQQMAEDEASAPGYGYFSEEEGNSRPRGVGGAPVGYAASRAGQPGYMFGPQPDAPMTQHQREVMTSDDRAKAAAWDEGHAAALANVEKVGKMTPAQMKALDRPEAKAVRALKADAYDEGKAAPRREMQSFQREQGTDLGQQLGRAPTWLERKASDVMHGNESAVPLPGPMAALQASQGPAQAGMAAYRLANPPAQPAPPPAPAPEPEGPGVAGYVSQLGSRAKAMVSDGDTKYGATDVGAMADANRSMKPRSYMYKPGYAEHEGQSAGEQNVGPIAQDMERDPIASTAIVKDPNTGLLGIDKDKGLKLVMGSVADLQAQFDAMKKGKR